MNNLILLLIIILILNTPQLHASDKEDLFVAIIKNDKIKIHKLIKSIDDLNYLLCKKINISDMLQPCTKTSPLHLAVYEQNIDAINLLLENKSNINILDELGLTPLHYSVIKDNLNITKLLIDNGASVHIKSSKIFEFNTGNGRMIMSKGRSPFHLSIGYSNSDIVKYFIEKGANINDTDGNGWTVLHIAIFNGREDIIKLLIEKGANIYAKTGVIDIEEMRDKFPAGMTPLDLAKILTKYSKEYEKVSNLLINYYK